MGVYVSHSEAFEPARAVDLDWEALRWRELKWGALSHTIRKMTIPYLMVREAGRLDCALTNREARPHLVKSPASYEYLYTDNEDYRALRW